MKENAIILFLKLPSKGKVKTRLEIDLGPELVFELYNAFISDILSICRIAEADTLIVYSPDAEAEAEYETLLAEYRSLRQRGDDLGERMFNAFTDVYQLGYSKCVLIGSDIPGIMSSTLETAFRMLENRDIVIGQSADGGYYLLGNTVQSTSYEYFRGIQWSRPDVYEITENLIVSAGFTLSRLEILNDIDILSDLVRFYETNSSNRFSETVMVISKNINAVFKE